MRQAEPRGMTADLTTHVLRFLHIIALVLFGMLIAACGGKAGTQQSDSGAGVATLTWQQPMMNEDGTPLTDLAGYRVFYGRSEDDLRYSMRIDNPTQTTAVVKGLTSGKWYFKVVAENGRGASQPSNIVSKVVP